MSRLFNCAELVHDPDFAVQFTVLRPRGGYDSTGVWKISGYDRIPFTGNIQPASPDVLKQLPEGERSGDVISIWTDRTVRMGDGEAVLSDVVLYGEKRYRLISSEVWPDNKQCYVTAVAYAQADLL